MGPIGSTTGGGGRVGGRGVWAWLVTGGEGNAAKNKKTEGEEENGTLNEVWGRG